MWIVLQHFGQPFPTLPPPPPPTPQTVPCRYFDLYLPVTRPRYLPGPGKDCHSYQNFRASKGVRMIWAGRGTALAGLLQPSFSLLNYPPIITRIRNTNPPPPPHAPLESSSHPSSVKEIAKEEQGECMEKLFRKTQGKHSSSGTRRREMARRALGAYLGRG